MKNLFSLSSLVLCSALLFSCEKEMVEPSLESLAQSNASAQSCQDYTYLNKISGPVNFGKARGEKILVRFSEGFPQAEQVRLLNRYPLFKAVEGEIFLDSGILTTVQLQAGTSCGEVEKMLAKLEREGAVQGAYLFFQPQSSSPDEEWIGLSNEFMVSLESGGTLAQLEQLVAQTRTKILFSFSDEIHVLSSDKNSAGSVLDVITFFNQQPSVAVAEPNLVYYFPMDVSTAEAASFQTAKSLKKGSFRKLQK